MIICDHICMHVCILYICIYNETYKTGKGPWFHIVCRRSALRLGAPCLTSETFGMMCAYHPVSKHGLLENGPLILVKPAMIDIKLVIRYGII